MSSVASFLAERRQDWARLEELVKRVGAGRTWRLRPEELDELGTLYRRAASDLAMAQRDFPADRVLTYLNQLVGRSHPVIYRGASTSWRRIVAFWLADFPRLFRSNAAYIITAALFFWLPAIAAFAATLADPSNGERLVPAPLVETIQQGQMWTEIPGFVRPLASSMITANNVQVAFLAFAGGVLLGLGSLYVLVQNGALLGAIAGLSHVHGLSLPLWAFVSSHGYLELSVVAIAGGAGLRMGWSILRPGLLPRATALVQGARTAVGLALGCVPLLALAGLLEGFVSPSGLPAEAKLAVGAATGLALYAYLLRAGRRPVTGEP